MGSTVEDAFDITTSLNRVSAAFDRRDWAAVRFEVRTARGDIEVLQPG